MPLGPAGRYPVRRAGPLRIIGRAHRAHGPVRAPDAGACCIAVGARRVHQLVPCPAVPDRLLAAPPGGSRLGRRARAPGQYRCVAGVE